MINYYIPFSHTLKVKPSGTWRAIVAVPTVITDSHGKHLRGGNTISVSIDRGSQGSNSNRSWKQKPWGMLLAGLLPDSQLALSFPSSPGHLLRNADTHNGLGSPPSVNNNQDNPH